MKVERSLLFHGPGFEKPCGRGDRTLCVERRNDTFVTEARDSYQPAGTWASHVHTRMYVPIERLALNWTHVISNDARRLLRFKRENVRDKIAQRREKGRETDKSNRCCGVNLSKASLCIYILYVIKSYMVSAITNVS